MEDNCAHREFETNASLNCGLPPSTIWMHSTPNHKTVIANYTKVFNSNFKINRVIFTYLAKFLGM